jgi:hypothetical protein
MFLVLTLARRRHSVAAQRNARRCSQNQLQFQTADIALSMAAGRIVRVARRAVPGRYEAETVRKARSGFIALREWGPVSAREDRAAPGGRSGVARFLLGEEPVSAVASALVDPPALRGAGHGCLRVADFGIWPGSNR